MMYYLLHSYNIELRLRTTDRLILLASHLPTALRNCVHELQNATSHDHVCAGVQRIMLYLVAARHHGIVELLLETQWLESLARLVIFYFYHYLHLQ